MMTDDQTRPFETGEYRNGQDDRLMKPAKPGPRMPGRRTVQITMGGEYRDAGFRLTIWANYPHRLALEVQSGDEDRTAAAMSQIVLEHNGWCDEDGMPLPLLKPAPMSAREGDEVFEDARVAFSRFWDCLPQELALAAQTAIGLEVGKLAKAVVERRRS